MPIPMRQVVRHPAIVPFPSLFRLSLSSSLALLLICTSVSTIEQPNLILAPPHSQPQTFIRPSLAPPREPGPS